MRGGARCGGLAGFEDEEELVVDRDPDLFQRVLSFLRSGSLATVPPFASNPEMWRALREEAC